MKILQSTKRLILVAAASFLMIGIFSCEETIENLEIDFNYEYFPLEIGKHIIYNVDSVTYSTLNDAILIDTATFQWRETVVDTFRDNAGRLIYEVEREQRNTLSENWQRVNVLAVYRGGDRLEWTEGNRKFLKMTYPLSDTVWDGNMYIDESEIVAIKNEPIELFKGWSYEVVSLDAPYDINNFNFNECLIITQANVENAIELRYSREVYAENVGLIYKEMKILDTQCISDCIDQTWEEKAERGFILKMSVVEYN